MQWVAHNCTVWCFDSGYILQTIPTIKMVHISTSPHSCPFLMLSSCPSSFFLGNQWSAFWYSELACICWSADIFQGKFINSNSPCYILLNWQLSDRYYQIVSKEPISTHFSCNMYRRVYFVHPCLNWVPLKSLIFSVLKGRGKKSNCFAVIFIELKVRRHFVSFYW